MTAMIDLVSGPSQTLAPLHLGKEPCLGQAQEGQHAVWGGKAPPLTSCEAVA